jgi:Zn-dependent protease with chaperone function
LPKFKCKEKKELDNIENIPTFICHEKKGRIYNAWYSPKKKGLALQKVFFDILSEEERKAVFYHEIEHSNIKFWDVMSRFTCSLWLASASGILTMLF